MNDPASIRPSGHRSHEVEAVETIGGVMTDLMDVTERLPVRPDQAEATARILDRLSEELGEAAGMLRAAHALPGTGKIELPRLREAFPLWRFAWVGGPDWAGFTATREGYSRVSATTAAALAARIFHEGSQR